MVTKVKSARVIIRDALETHREPADAYGIRQSIEDYLRQSYRNVEYKATLIHAYNPYVQDVPERIWVRCIHTASGKDVELLRKVAREKWIEILSNQKKAWCVLVTNLIGPWVLNWCRDAGYPPIVLIYWDEDRMQYWYDHYDIKPRKYVEKVWREKT